MTNHKLLLAPVLITLCLLAAKAPGQTVTPPADEAARLRAELEPKITETIRSGRLPGFAIGVVKDGKLDLRERLWPGETWDPYAGDFPLVVSHGVSDQGRSSPRL